MPDDEFPDDRRPDEEARLIARGVESAERRSRDVDRFERAQAQSAEQDVRLKGFYAYFLLAIMLGQLVVADAGFFFYADVGKRWAVDASIMHVWLGATVVEVIGIVLVVTRYLFPRRHEVA